MNIVMQLGINFGTFPLLNVYFNIFEFQSPTSSDSIDYDTLPIEYEILRLDGEQKCLVNTTTLENDSTLSMCEKMNGNTGNLIV